MIFPLDQQNHIERNHDVSQQLGKQRQRRLLRHFHPTLVGIDKASRPKYNQERHDHKREQQVIPAICSTSHPLQTGFSPALGAGFVGSGAGGGKGTTTNGAAVCGSPVSGCGSNCGFSGDDKKDPFFKLFGPQDIRQRAAAVARGLMALSSFEYFRRT